MKRLIFFLALILSFSACSEFHHLHYRHVKKVPAKGFVEELSTREKKNPAEEKFTALIDSSATVETKIMPGKRDSSVSIIHHPGCHPPVLQKQKEKLASSKQIIRKKLKLEKSFPHRKGGDGSVFKIVVFLFLGLCLMLIGGSLVLSAVYGFSLWMLLLGLVIFLLGALPYLGLFSFAFGRFYKKDVPRYDEKR